MHDHPQSTVYRAAILHFISDPSLDGDKAYEFYQDGVLLVTDGKVVKAGPAEAILHTLNDDVEMLDYTGYLICPGFIDSHIHYPQLEMIASYGEQLLDWLNKYTFPVEQQFEDPEYAATSARIFIDELLRCGTTTAAVFGTVHTQSVEAFFNASHARNTRMICGKVMMDRHAPKSLCDTPLSSYQDSQLLIEKWHEHGRQLYAITPRFAYTSTPEQLAYTGQLCREYPSVYMQTHIAENQEEVSRTRALFPNNKDYLDVYDQHGLLSERSILAHGIHLNARERQRLEATGARIAFCPTSNFFLGSGLLDLAELEHANVEYGIASDVGAGTSVSMLQTLNAAYKVCQLTGQVLDPFKSMYLATLGNAKALKLEHKIGSFKTGNEADFIVLDFNCTPLMALRQSKAKTLSEKLFALIMLGDDRAIKATYISGKSAHQRDQ